MTTYGVISTGFLKKPLETVVEELEDDERELISASLNLLPSGVYGQTNGIFGGKLAEMWDVAEANYAASYPDTATDAGLDGILALTGTTRLAASESTVTLDRIFLEDGATIPAGSTVSVGALGVQFETLAAVSNSLGYASTFSVAAQSVETGEQQGLAGTIDTIQSPETGWSAACAVSAGNTETYALSNGQTLTVKVDQGAEQTATFETADFVAIGAATAAEVAAVIDTDISGATAADEGGMPRITSDTDGTGSAIQVTGGTANTALGFPTVLIKGFNSLDATLGRDEETDAEARLRREQLFSLGGAGTVEAIRAQVLEVDDVLQCFVFSNRTMTVDGDGLPAKSFEVVVSGGAAADIAETIWEYMPAGIEDHGDESEIITDSQGFSQTIYFTRPTELDMYIDITVTTDSTYPSDGDAQVKAALVAFGDALQIGEDVIVAQMKSCVLESNGGVTGVTDVTVFEVDEVTPPVNTANYTVDSRELAVFDTSRIVVTS